MHPGSKAIAEKWHGYLSTDVGVPKVRDACLTPLLVSMEPQVNAMQMLQFKQETFARATVFTLPCPYTRCNCAAKRVSNVSYQCSAVVASATISEGVSATVAQSELWVGKLKHEIVQEPLLR